MSISRKSIILRGLLNRCPNCGEKTLFKKTLKLNEKCPDCALVFERGEGFFLGSMSINYSFTTIFCLVPIALLWYLKILPSLLAVIMLVIGALATPVLFYRSSRSWWLMVYFLVLPHELPDNRTDAIPVDD